MKYGIAVAGTHGKTTTTSLLGAGPARGRARSDRRGRRQAARARHQRAARAGRVPGRRGRRERRHVPPALAHHRGRDQHRPRAPRSLRRHGARARGVPAVHPPRAVLRARGALHRQRERARRCCRTCASASSPTAPRPTPTGRRASCASRACETHLRGLARRASGSGTVRLRMPGRHHALNALAAHRGGRRARHPVRASPRTRSRSSAASTAASRCRARSAASWWSTTTATTPRRSAPRCARPAKASTAASSSPSSRIATRARAISSTTSSAPSTTPTCWCSPRSTPPARTASTACTGDALYQALKRRGHLDVRFVPERASASPRCCSDVVRPGDLVLHARRRRHLPHRRRAPGAPALRAWPSPSSTDDGRIARRSTRVSSARARRARARRRAARAPHVVPDRRAGRPAGARPTRPPSSPPSCATAARRDVPLTLLGGGSNMLVGDGGIRGVVVKLGREFRSVEWTTPTAVRGGRRPVQLGKLARAGGRRAASPASSTPRASPAPSAARCS